MKSSLRFCLLLLLLNLGSTSLIWAQRFFIIESEVSFLSDAPLEKISASSSALKGVLDFSARSFAFSLQVRSFKGFNSELQAEHFHENYMESEKYPLSTYSGKIIDEFNPAVPGKYPVRVKGMFTIKGVPRERILKGILETKSDGTMILNCDFSILLDEYSIRIPRVVYQKIAPEIQVKLNATLSTTAK